MFLRGARGGLSWGPPFPRSPPACPLSPEKVDGLSSLAPLFFCVFFLCRFQCPQLPEYLKLVFQVRGLLWLLCLFPPTFSHPIASVLS